MKKCKFKHFSVKIGGVIMANEKNLKPVRNKTEARERGKVGGVKSGESRRRKKTLRDTMELLLSAPLTDEETAEMTASGLNVKDIDRRAVLAVGLYKRAAEGDTKAYSLIAEMLGEESQTAADKADYEADKERIRKIFSGDLE
jgi:hypothetical protein